MSEFKVINGVLRRSDDGINWVRLDGENIVISTPSFNLNVTVCSQLEPEEWFLVTGDKVFYSRGNGKDETVQDND